MQPEGKGGTQDLARPRFRLRSLIALAGGETREAAVAIRARSGNVACPNTGGPTEVERIGEELLRPGRFALLLAAVILAAFPDVLLGRQTFVYKDFGLFAYPLASYHKECFWRGELPLWNPLSACGIPFLAQWNTLTLYPLSLIYLLGPMPWALNFFCIAHLFLAGMGMYFLGVQWTQSRVAGAVAGMAFAFGGNMLTALGWPACMAAFGWMPWLVLCATRAWQEGGRQLPLAAFVGAMQMLSGAAEIIGLTWCLIGCLWVHDVFRRGHNRVPQLWRGPVLVALVAAIAAVQLLPFLELVAHSHRDAAFAKDRWAMPAWGWANLLVPLFRAYPSAYGVYLQSDQSMLTSYYAGIITIALPVVAFLHSRDRRLWIAAAATLLCLVLAWGDNSWLYAWLRETFPQAGFMRFPVKFVWLPAFLFPLMLALSIGALQRLPPVGGTAAARSGAMVVAGTLAVMIFIVCLSFGYPVTGENWRTVLANATVRFGLFALAMLGLFCGLRSPAMRWSRLLPTLVALIVAADGLTHMRVIQPTTVPEVYAPGFLEMKPKPEPGSARAYISMSAHRELYRFLPELDKTYAGYRLGGIDNTPLLDGVPMLDGFYALYLREQRELWSELFFKPGADDDGLLDFLGVTQISTAKLDWSPRTTALPLVTAGQAAHFREGQEMIAALRDEGFDPRLTVFLPPSVRGLVRATNHVDARVGNTRFQSHRIKFDVEAAGPAMVTVSQAYYRPWTASVNGIRVPLLRANFAFQALEVPPGKSRVQLVYEDSAFRLGAWISLVGLLTCAALWWGSPRIVPARPESASLMP